ncbi:MAG TPA: transposase [Planctomycetota bacterium]|nr:transposase [Planctomycetota bacterium]
MWNLLGPPGFQGLRSDLPVTMYERNLPHWRQDGVTYFVTFRLCDSLPQSKLDELESYRNEWMKNRPLPFSKAQKEELALEVMRRIEAWLDQGMGSCLMRDTRVAKIVSDAFHHFDNARYELGCYVIMPNHVHLIVKPTQCDFSLEKILQSIKVHSALEINRLNGTSGKIWQDESFDRIVRDEEHLYRIVQYIGANPTKAHLAGAACPRWIRPEWEQSGWRFDWDKNK